MAKMKLSKFIKQLNLAFDNPSFYEKSGWGKWNKLKQKWGWDCVCLIKGILWGWNNDTSKPRGGGAVYGSNGVPDIGTEKMIDVCDNVSNNFASMSVGELVWMNGHVGICIKPPKENQLGEIIEATTAFGGGVKKSKINTLGQRLFYETGKYAGPTWKKHGFLPYVDYGEEPTPEPLTPIKVPSRGYFKKGDKGQDVAKIDQWLYEKYGNKKTIGDLYGDNTVNDVKKVQKEGKLLGIYDDNIDGCTGKKTLEAMRKMGFPY